MDITRIERRIFLSDLNSEMLNKRITQKELGERIGKKREYISALEQGQTDMQLSTFMLISNALGLRFSLVVGSYLLFIISFFK